MLLCPVCDSPMSLQEGIDVVCDQFQCQCGLEIKAPKNTVKVGDHRQIPLPLVQNAWKS